MLRRLILAALVSCAAREQPPQTVAPLSYAENSRWICLPGAAFDACKTELTATVIAPDGTRSTVTHRPLKDPKVDCFYVYPTVDNELVPGNHDDFRDARRERNTTLAQVGLFTEACAVWAPLYRQVTIGTYLRSDDRLERGLAFAFGDVEAAFREFLSRTSPQRKMVLVGHSQGAGMVIRLLRKFFENDPAMRDRLLLAMPIGGDLETDSFANIPLCTKPDETGCIVTYRSYTAGDPIEVAPRWMPSPGHTTACVDPASIDGGTGRFSRSFFPIMGDVRRFMRNIDGIETPYIELRDHYAGRCVTMPSGFSYLGVTESSPGPFDMHKRFFKMGLHLADMQLTEGDLVDMIQRRAAKL
jgi:hypothetical protein